MPQQNVNLKISGLYLAPNDFGASPPGALDAANNIVIDQQDLAQYRNGFDGLEFQFPNTNDFAVRFTEYQNTILARYGTASLGYYSAVDGWHPYVGTFANPSSDTKSRFNQANKNLYVTTASGVQVLDSYNGTWLPAGVPKGLDLQASLTGSGGFFIPNVVTTITANTSSGSPTLKQLSGVSQIQVGQYISGTGVTAGTVVQSITPSSTILQVVNATTTAGANTITVSSIAGVSAGVLVTGDGISASTRVTGTSGAGPFTVTLNNNAFASSTTASIQFSSDPLVTMSANATATNTATSLIFSSGAQVGYRLVFGIRDANQNLKLGAPSQPAIVTNNQGTSVNCLVTGSIPSGITTNFFYQLYRSPITAGASITPLDQYQLVYEAPINSTDLSNGYVSITDAVPDSLKGVSLYAGSDQDGILQSNDPPPFCHDTCTFLGMTLYANTTSPESLKLTILGVGSPNGVQSGDTLVIGGVTFTADSSENTATGHFKVFTSGTPAQNIADTANSLIKVINRFSSSTIYAYLLSGVTDLPGQIELQVRNAGGPVFVVTASAHGSAYSPTLPTSGTTVSSTQDTNLNGIAVSKLNQPEAVPLTNLSFAGDASLPIRRIMPLRSYVLILKDDGIYRLTGSTPQNISIVPFDLSTHIIGPETAATLANQVWMLSNLGVVSVSDTGVQVRSRPISNIFIDLLGHAIDTVKNVAFAVGYETANRYILAIPGGEGDENCKEQYTFNYLTSAWTHWDREVTTAFVRPSEDKLYIGRGDIASASAERKAGDFTDYVDEAIDVTISAFTNYTVTLAEVTGINIGDILRQSNAQFSEVLAIDPTNSTVTVNDLVSWDLGAAEMLPAISATLQWKPVVSNNPAYARQYPEGILIFKSTLFSAATISFYTDISQSIESVPLVGFDLGLWGRFPWGGVPWGGLTKPRPLRFYIPANKQYASELSPIFSIREGYSTWSLQGLSISYNPISEEVS